MLGRRDQVRCNRRERAQVATGALFFALLLSCALASSCVSVQYQTQQPYYSTEVTTENQTESYVEAVAVPRSIAHEQSLTPYILWSNPQLRFQGHTGIWYYAYDLSGFPVHPGERIRITFLKQRYYEYISLSVFDMSPRGQILAPPLISLSDNALPPAVPPNWITAKNGIATFDKWMNLANVKLDFARFLVAKTDLFLNHENAPPVELETRGVRDIAVILSGTEEPHNCRFVATLEWSDTIVESVTGTAQRSVPVQVEHQIMKQRSVVQTKQVPFWEAIFGNRQTIPGQ